VASSIPLTLDQIVAVKHEGPTVMSNLASACLRCNAHKGTDLTTLLHGELVRLFHPRLQTWTDHFRVHRESGRIRGQTLIGTATARLLLVNGGDRAAIRRELVRLNLLPVEALT
jgi:5-methylcytosine-specific restriction endonuclease McrA